MHVDVWEHVHPPPRQTRTHTHTHTQWSNNPTEHVVIYVVKGCGLGGRKFLLLQNENGHFL